MTAHDTEAASEGEQHAEGVVIRSTGSWYEVQPDEGDAISARVRGKFRLADDNLTNPVAVGDRVRLRLEPDGSGLITEVKDRETMLCRRAAGRRVGKEQIIAANVDSVWVVQAVRLPRPNPGFIDRVIVMAERHELGAGIVFNKLDLLRPKDREAFEALSARYERIGYPVFRVSALRGDGIEALKEALAEKVSVVTGPSGTGKSTLLNAIEPQLELETGEVSEHTRKGRHTTTFAARYPLSGGGYVVDTPGIREFGVIDMEDWELSHYFPEFVPFIHECRFPNCTHDHEPDCAVRDAVDAGEIDEERYLSYLSILDSIHLGEHDVGR